MYFRHTQTSQQTLKCFRGNGEQRQWDVLSFVVFAEVGPDQVTLLVDLCEASDAVDTNTAKADLDTAYAELCKVDAFSDEGLLLQKRIDLAQARIAH